MTENTHFVCGNRGQACYGPLDVEALGLRAANAAQMLGVGQVEADTTDHLYRRNCECVSAVMVGLRVKVHQTCAPTRPAC
jgi:hypothetical protein